MIDYYCRSQIFDIRVKEKFISTIRSHRIPLKKKWIKRKVLSLSPTKNNSGIHCINKNLALENRMVFYQK